MTKDEALKLGLEALEADPLEMVADVDGHMVFLKDKAITAIKEALAQPEQEPVAWQFMKGSSFRKHRPDHFDDLASDGLPYWKPLYTTPPQRPWVGLTDEELREFDVDPIEAKLMIAKLKEKNHD